MAIYKHLEVANSPSAYWGDVMGASYTASATLITIVNADTTLTRAHGAFAIVNGFLAGGTVVSLERTSANGAVTYETLTGFTRDAVLFVNDAPDQRLLGIMGKTQDTLTGYSGNDILDGYDDPQGIVHPVDTMKGGLGDDTYRVSHDVDTVIEEKDSGYDTIITRSFSLTLPANVEKLVKLGDTPFGGTGNELDNTFVAMESPNSTVVLDGLEGNDTFYLNATFGAAYGGVGDDNYYIYSQYSGAFEEPGEGYDRFYTGIDSYDLPDNIEELHLIGNVGLTGIGNDEDNKIFGTAKSDSLLGLDGDDELHGYGGTNTLIGGKGDDTYFVDSATDYVDEHVDEGYADTVKTALATWKLQPNVERLVFLPGLNVGRIGTGNALGNEIYGADKDDALFGLGGDDELHGRGGADTLVGGIGNDAYYVDSYDDKVVEFAGEGTDDRVIITTLATYQLPANVEILGFHGDGSHHGVGNELDNFMYAYNGPNTFYGLEGNDTLQGNGADKLYGGKGDDRYFASPGDTIIENADEGDDLVDLGGLTSTYQLAENVERLRVSDSTGTVFGNGLDNTIEAVRGSGVAVFGGDGNDTLYSSDNTIYGPGGSDALYGQNGNDTLYLAIGTDAAIGGTGDDTAVVDGSLSDFDVLDRGDWIFLNRGSDHYAASEVEHIQFRDGTVDVADGNPLFDSLFYMHNNLDVFHAGVNGLDHFNASGRYEGRNPNAFFDTSEYLSVYQDAAASGMNPLDHYHQVGWLQGHDPAANFDTRLYLARNPDVAAAGIDPLQHYLQSGMAEGRQAYTALGDSIAGGFDAEFYLRHNPDVAAAGVDPLAHFNASGWHEGRNPDAWFDTAGYLAHYADVAASGVNPLEHYMQFGWKEGRDPSAQFDTLGYLANNPDVAAGGANPLDHFLVFGIYEGRQAVNDGVWH
jgi:Ca2+-binding RTX toxin-like protein